MDIQDKFIENDNLNLHFKQQQHQDLSFSFFPFSPTLFDNDDYGFFPHHHHDLLVSHCWPVYNPSTASTATESVAAHQHQLDLLTAVTNNKAEVSLNDIKNDDGFAIGILDPPNKIISDSKTNNIATKKASTKRSSKKRSPGKKDRHSKIVTAQGPRDRRMRLSVDIARKFFDLQDMLGVDKASKTLEWLLNKSKPAIKEIMKINTIRKSVNDGVSAKESNISTAWELLSETERMAPEHQNRTFPEEKPSKHGQKEKQIRQQSCKATFQPLARELRVKARARARERTIQKRMNQPLQELKKCIQGKTQNFNKIRSFCKVGESGPLSHAMKSFIEVRKPTFKSKEHPRIILDDSNKVDHNIHDSFMTLKSSPTSSFNNHTNIGVSSHFQENRNVIDRQRVQAIIS